MNRNLDKDDIRDASDLLTHIDGWEKTGRYDEEAIKELDRWHRKRNQIARDADALYEQLYARYQAYVDEHPVHKQQAEDIAVDMVNHNMSDSHIGTIGKGLTELYEGEGTDLDVLTQHVLADGYEQRLWHILHDVNSLLLDEDQFYNFFFVQ